MITIYIIIKDFMKNHLLAFSMLINSFSLSFSMLTPFVAPDVATESNKKRRLLQAELERGSQIQTDRKLAEMMHELHMMNTSLASGNVEAYRQFPSQIDQMISSANELCEEYRSQDRSTELNLVDEFYLRMSRHVKEGVEEFIGAHLARETKLTPHQRLAVLCLELGNAEALLSAIKVMKWTEQTDEQLPGEFPFTPYLRD